MSEISQETLERLIERGADESAPAYAAFLFYASLAPFERNRRSLPQVAEHCGLAVETLTSYRIDFKWDERSSSIDAYLFKQQIERRFELTEENDKRYAENLREIQQKTITTSKKAFAVIENMLDKAEIATGETRESDFQDVLQPDGSHVKKPMKTIIEMKEQLRDVAPLWRAAAELPLKVAGYPTETIQHNVLQSGSSKVREMTEEELNQYALNVQKELEKSAGVQALPDQP